VIRVQAGDRLRFAEERNSYTVQAVSVDGRWAVCTKPFKARGTVLYSIVDFDADVRGVDDRVFSAGYETAGQCEEAVTDLSSGEMALSRRHAPIPLRIVRWEALVGASQ
jgi:hypothetical protein